MPFAQMVKEKLIKIGDSAFNIKLDFDEKHVLEVNKSYLENTLDVSKYIMCNYNILFCKYCVFYYNIHYTYYDFSVGTFWSKIL